MAIKMTRLGFLTLFILLLAAVAGYFLFFGQRGVNLALNDQDAIIGEETPPANIEPFNDALVSEDSGGDIPGAVRVAVVTNKGTIELELYPTIAPKTVANFMLLAGQDFYDGLKFHRVIPDFMIQGGDPLSVDDDPGNDGKGGPNYTFEDEINPKSLGLSSSKIAELENLGYEYDYGLQSLPVKVGTIAMANRGPDTNGSQFFIVTIQDQPHLNGLHTVFGKVVKGMEVVRSIEQGDIIEDIELPEQEN